MIDVHVMKLIPPYGAFGINAGLSPMCLSCPTAGNRPLTSRIQTTVRVPRP